MRVTLEKQVELVQLLFSLEEGIMSKGPPGITSEGITSKLKRGITSKRRNNVYKAEQRLKEGITTEKQE